MELPLHLQTIQTYVQSVMSLVGDRISLKHLLLDGAFGNNNALQMCLRSGLHLVSKLRFDAALFFPYQGEQKKRGRPKKYGDKLDMRQLPTTHLVKTISDETSETCMYQFQAWNKNFPDLLNIVVLVRTQHQTGRIGHVILFSSDLELEADRLVDLYSLRFQIEFNFRDAKQFWGLEDL